MSNAIQMESYNMRTRTQKKSEHKTAVILQSNYIPWKGYFDLINSADEFIFYDTVRYTEHDWRNRNRIKTYNGLQWISIPVVTKNRYDQAICEARVLNGLWARKHWNAIRMNYTKAPHFKKYSDIFKSLYEELENEVLISKINFRFIQVICELLGCSSNFTWSGDYQLIDGKTERLVDLCEKVEATHYISGPAAKEYIDETVFKSANIELIFKDYSGYPEYPQLYGSFEHNVSVLDLLFNMGDEAHHYIWGWRAST